MYTVIAAAQALYTYCNKSKLKSSVEFFFLDKERDAVREGGR